MVDSLYYSSRKIAERCENSFVDYKIDYQKLCYLMRQITKDLNSASETNARFQITVLVRFGSVWFWLVTVLLTVWPRNLLLCPFHKKLRI